MKSISDIKKGQVWKPRLGGTPIEIVKPKGGNNMWQTKKLNRSPKSHHIHEGTLRRFYRLQA